MTFSAELPVPRIPVDEVRAVTEDVLSRPEYVEARPSLLEQAVTAVVEYVGRLLALLSGGGRGSVIGTIVLLLACAVLALAAVRFLRRVGPDPRRAAAHPDAIRRDAADWRRDAERHEDLGHWREALRCRYRALVAELAAAGLVDEVPGRTSGEYLAAISKDVPQARDAFTAATRAFEAAWYGASPVTASDVAAFRASAAAVLRAASGSSRRRFAGSSA